MYKKLPILIFFILPTLLFALPGPYFKAEVGEIAEAVPFPIYFLTYADSSGIGGRIAAGYLFGNSHFNYGIEAGTLIYPHLSGHNCSLLENCSLEIVQGYGMDVLGVIQYTFDSHFLVFGKGGAIYNHQKIINKNMDTWNGVETWNETQETKISYSPELALGIGYQLSNHTEIILTESTMLTHQSMMNTLLLGISYSF